MEEEIWESNVFWVTVLLCGKILPVGECFENFQTLNPKNMKDLVSFGFSNCQFYFIFFWRFTRFYIRFSPVFFFRAKLPHLATKKIAVLLGKYVPKSPYLEENKLKSPYLDNNFQHVANTNCQILNFSNVLSNLEPNLAKSSCQWRPNNMPHKVELKNPNLW